MKVMCVIILEYKKSSEAMQNEIRNLRIQSEKLKQDNARL